MGGPPDPQMKEHLLKPVEAHCCTSRRLNSSG